MSKKPHQPLVQTRLAQKTFDGLKRLAKADGRTMAAYVRRALTLLSEAPSGFDLREQILSHQRSFSKTPWGIDDDDSNPGHISLSGPDPD